MAVIDTVTIGTDTFSVYALVLTEANENTDTFWNGRLGAERTAWEAATEDDQNRAMVAAADWIDRALNFTGDKTVASQDRAWPRDNATNNCTGTPIADGTTPDDIFYTQAYLAGAILVDNSAATGGTQGSNIKKVAAGSANVEFFKPTINTASDVRLPQVAHDYSKCYTESTASLTGPTASGTSQPSSFCEDDFEWNEGMA